MSFFGKVADFFRGVGAKVKAAYIAVFGDAAGEALAKASLEFLKTELGKAAFAVVEGLESAAMSGADKKSAAFKAITDSLAAQGKNLPKDAIDFAIQLALRSLKSGLTPPAE